jgi:UDP-glucose 4-epimerase
MHRTILIGGAGFIGKHLAKLLIEAGREVYVVGRSKSAPKELSPECCYVTGNYGDINTLQKILTPGCEVVDLAYSTVPKTSFDDPLYDLNSNLPSSVKLMEEALRIGVRRIVLVSSGGTVYGPVESLPITENYPTRPISPYGITKLAVEHYALMYHRNGRLPVVVVRPGNAYGEDQRVGTGQGFLAAALNSTLSGSDVEIYGQKGTIRDYVHVSDVASGVMAALMNGYDGNIYNLGTGVGTSNIDIISMLQEFAEKDGFIVRTRILPARGYDVESNVLDSSRLRNHTGWSPKIGLKEGIQKIWNAAKNKKLSEKNSKYSDIY